MDMAVTEFNQNEKKEKRMFHLIQKIYHLLSKIILYFLIFTLIIIMVLFALYFIDIHHNIKSGIKRRPLFGAYIIISPSMVPTINVEDAILIQRKEENELKVGDIITFLSTDPRYSGLTITHRIVGIEKSKKGDFYFRTKGDNNNAEDSTLVSYKNICGKVIFKIPKIGYFQQILTNVYGWLFLIIIPCITLVIYDVIKLFKSIKFSKTNNKNQISNNDNSENYIEFINVEAKEEKKNNENHDDDIEII